MHAENTAGQHALYCASENGHAHCVQALLRYGSNVQHLGDDGRSALWIASLNGHIDCVRLLLNSGAHVVTTKGRRRRRGASALDAATARGHTAVAALLKQHLEAEKKTDDSPKPSTAIKHKLKSWRKKQPATNSEGFHTLTDRLNDSTNTVVKRLRHDVAALQLSNIELQEKLSELETRLQHEHTERRKPAKRVQKHERQKCDEPFRARSREERPARRKDLRFVISIALQKPDDTHKGKQ